MENVKILGPVLIPNLKLVRYHEEIGAYNLVFLKKDIILFKEKFDKEQKSENLSINHKGLSEGNITNSFLVSSKNKKELPELFQHLPYGTWMIEISLTEKTYQKLNELGIRGFSAEGSFTIKGKNGKSYTVYEKFRIMNKLSDILPFDVHVFGGSTSGVGRNEHGLAHFQLKEKNTRKDLGKINMPSLNIWTTSTDKEKIEMLYVENGEDIPKKQKKVFAVWLCRNGNENLLKCHKQWNDSNKDNNRTEPI